MAGLGERTRQSLRKDILGAQLQDGVRMFDWGLPTDVSGLQAALFLCV